MGIEEVTGKAEFIKGIYQALCQVLDPKWNSPLETPIPVSQEFIKSIHQVISEMKQYWEIRYGEMLLRPAEDLREILTRRTLLDQYGKPLEGTIKHLA